MDYNQLIDKDYLKNHINEILSLNQYIPMILTGIMREINIDPKVYSKWKYSIRQEVNKDLWSVYIKQKSLSQTFAHICSAQGKKSEFYSLLELLIFLNLHPQFKELIKDENYLNELIGECEKEYNFRVNYINSYEDIKILLSILKDSEETRKVWEEKIETIPNMVDKVYSILISEELIYLDDFVPKEFLSDYTYKKRNKWLNENNKLKILELNHNYNIGRYKIKDLNKRLLSIMFEWDDFIEKYPQYSQLIPEYDAFEKYGNKLIQEIEKTER